MQVGVPQSWPWAAARIFRALVVASLLATSEAAGPSDKNSPSATCGTPVKSEMSGELLSHSTYARCEYPPKLSCQWDLVGIPSNPSARIEFSFVSYEMPNEKPSCKDSYLNFYNKETNKLEMSLCNGRRLPPKFALGSQVRVVFQSTKDEKGITAKGFHMKWRVVRECQKDDFICKNGDCIPKEFHCDGGSGLPLEDCDDMSDESDCKSRIMTRCPKSDEMLCNNKLRCFDKLKQCDGAPDCRDGTDEINCPDQDCKERPGELPCKHKKTCYNAKEQGCDGKKDCRDNSDEEKCVVQTCTDKEFRCAHKFMCIPKIKECDGVKDCNDNSDERHCKKVTCTADQLPCDKGYRCYNKKNQCDGTQHCSDGDDESRAYCKPLDKCPKAGEALCDHKFACIDRKQVCDMKEDCTDSSDEKYCNADGLTCSATQLRCKTARCVENSQRCDKRPDCMDQLDEEGCLHATGDGPPCAVNHIWCRGAQKCIRATLACNGVSDCGGGDDSDEENCPASPAEACKTSWHRCDNRQYISASKLCDGKGHCADGSDEKGCSTG